MGAGRWDSRKWSTSHATHDPMNFYSSSASPTVDHIYTSKTIDKGLDPSLIKIRESRDSADNPNSTALIVGLDVTGSMMHVLDHMAREGLGTLVGQIYERQPISDPHVMIMGIGDFECDRSPLQATQFEAANDPLVAQMEKLYLERGGGGNRHESYAAAWLFAAQKTSIDCFEKRGKRGYLFTVGDEEPTPALYAKHLQKVFGDEYTHDLDGAYLLAAAQATYNCFHVIVEEGDYATRYPDRVREEWSKIIGQNLLMLKDHKKLAEVVVSAIQMAEGADRDAVVKSWSGDTSVVVAHGLSNLTPGSNPDAGTGMKLAY